MNDTMLVSSLLMFGVIVAALTIACGAVGLFGLAVAWIVRRYTVEHVSTELDKTDDDLLT